ncbi:MAG TPA: 16S rRNA (guanine(527)-N(7))-methyltransferase RsmG [Stenotrophobium sp.]|nr:16S rRNA (guanine(527)-N(7))-methyltransferase RsmG [Stenotrophobium sp.]
MTDPSRRLLDAGIRELGFSLPAGAVQRLLDYQAELLKWNAAYNLTAIRAPEQMVTRHLLDSLALLPLVPHGPASARLLDVGSGAGLPGIVLALADPALQVVTLDSNGKKARFMRHAVRTLGLDNVEVAEARVEVWRPAVPFDGIVSRAFASLADFFDKTAHLLAPGGQWLAMKGKLDAAEMAGIPANIIIRETHRLRVPGLNEDRHVVMAMVKT